MTDSIQIDDETPDVVYHILGSAGYPKSTVTVEGDRVVSVAHYDEAAVTMAMPIGDDLKDEDKMMSYIHLTPGEALGLAQHLIQQASLLMMPVTKGMN